LVFAGMDLSDDDTALSLGIAVNPSGAVIEDL
jgi:hypothetical protein